MGIKAYYFDLAFQLGLRTDLQIRAVAEAAVLNFVMAIWFADVSQVRRHLVPALRQLMSTSKEKTR